MSSGRPRRRPAAAAAVLLAALGAMSGSILWTLPPPPIATAAAAVPATSRLTFVPGALHVHSVRSDGSGSVDEIAAAASRAGLSFVILTDHGDATRPPDPPQYRSGVLLIDAVEVSTMDGHYIAVGTQPAPYPLGGEGRDVVADVRRLGGFGIVAHPDSDKAALGWRAWEAPFDAIEWLNADSEWRDEPRLRVLRAFFHYPWRPAESIASLLDRPERTLTRWDDVTSRRQVVGVAGSDAHARIGLRGGLDPYEPGPGLRIPSYEASFKAFGVRLGLRQPLERNAARDGAAIISALREGRAYTALDAVAGPPRFDFHAEADGQIAQMGERVESAGRVRLVARIEGIPGARLALVGTGRVVASGTLAELVQEVEPSPAAYRIEVQLDRAPGTPPVPWIVSNPIYVGPQADPDPPAAPREGPKRPLRRPDGPSRWTIERDPTSRAEFGKSLPAGAESALDFTLGTGGRDTAAFAALRHRLTPDLRGFDRVILTAWSDRPRRVSIQLRTPEEPFGRRWRRSIYLDDTKRQHVIDLSDMREVERNGPQGESIRDADSLLMVVDTVNTRAGVSGTIWVGETWVQP